MIDYSTYSDAELIESFGNVDPKRFPENFAALERELLVRGIPLAPVQAPDPRHAAAQNLFETPEVLQILRDRISGKIVPKQSHSMLMILGVLAYTAITSLRGDWMYVVCIIPILFLHELGHLVAMKTFGFKNVSIFFIPFFGAMTTGIQTQPSRRKEAIISLAGPLFGIATGVLGLLAFQYYPAKYLLYFAEYSFWINLFNLLPILPFDGGHYWDALLASRNYFVSMAFKAMTVVALAGGAYFLQSWVMGLLAWFIVVQINDQRLEQAAKSRLGFTKLADPENLGDDEIKKVVAAVIAVTKNPTEERSIPVIADRTVRLCSNLSIPSAPWPFTIGALVVYGALMAVGVSVFAITNQLKAGL